MKVRMVPVGGEDSVLEFAAKLKDDFAEKAMEAASVQGKTIPKDRYRFERRRQITTWEPVGASVELAS